MNTPLLQFAKDVLKADFGVEGSVTQLPGELDFNFYVEADAGLKKFVLKIANEKESREILGMQNALINHLSGQQTGLETSKVCIAKSGEQILQRDVPGYGKRFLRLLTWVDGRVFANVKPHSPELLFRLGEMCGKLSRALMDFDHPASHRFIKWDPSRLEWTKDHLSKFSNRQEELAKYFYDLFQSNVIPLLPQLRMGVNYNDANDYNALVRSDGTTSMIDFGDAVYTHTINELAVAIAYAMMDKPNPVEAACHVVRGFNETFNLKEEELEVLFPLICARLLISVTCAELNRLDHPENKYLQISDRPAWELLEKLRNYSPVLVRGLFRTACGLPAIASEVVFNDWAACNFKYVRFPVPASTNTNWLDLSVGSPDLDTIETIQDARALDDCISSIIQRSGATLSFGKYNEARAIYTTPAFVEPSNDGLSWRTIHIGTDFFAEPGTPVYALWDGTVHSFANNSRERDYGPTIVLQHKVLDDLTFYTLYGHLSEESLKDLAVGSRFKAGDRIGSIGKRHENGNWTPHLHLQVMLDMLGYQGDFPGTSTAQAADTWRSLCPDPWFLLTGQKTPTSDTLSIDDIVSYRKQHVGKNLSISYRQPIKMVRGAGQYLIDDTGRKYLDTVNNVAHVGHENARVVRAGQRQMAVLNTNTRYLHENLVRFVDELLTTMPKQLNVAFVVNSGSEANELAMRIAKTHTGQRDMIVSQVGYHGNTNACIDISSYKFDGKGGKGKPDHVHVVPIPDTYRGIYRSDDNHAGGKYALHVREIVDRLQSQNKQPAALILESVISCGGQVELPKDFLNKAYGYVRTARGVCIADEVQTGCGRAGDHFWAFEQHGVVPDIVTIGKPIGNGHPLGVVVTTQELANSFKNGMEYFNTFGGNPVSCAIGLEVLRVIKEEKLQENSRNIGAYLKSGLQTMMNEFDIIGDVRGPGLFIGFELVKDRITKEPATIQASYFANRMRDKGILMSTDGPFENVLKIKPPIVFSKTDADFLMENIRRVLKEDSMKS